MSPIERHDVGRHRTLEQWCMSSFVRNTVCGIGWPWIKKKINVHSHLTFYYSLSVRISPHGCQHHNESRYHVQRINGVKAASYNHVFVMLLYNITAASKLNKSPTRCNSMQSDLFHSKITLHVSGVTAPIIRSTKNCNRLKNLTVRY